MSTLSRVIVSALVGLALVGCASSDYGTKQAVGALAGAGAGGLLGAQVGEGSTRLAATAAGTLLGAFLGNEVGKSLDRADAVHASRAQYQALEYTPSGYSTSWRNPDTGHYGRVTPIETYEHRGRLVLPRVPAPGADRRPQPRGLWHCMPYSRWPVAGGELRPGPRRPRMSGCWSTSAAGGGCLYASGPPEPRRHGARDDRSRAIALLASPIGAAGVAAGARPRYLPCARGRRGWPTAISSRPGI